MRIIVLLVLCLSPFALRAEGSAVAQAKPQKHKLIKVAEGWAANSVNTTVFRRNSIVTFEDTQFVAYYDQAGFMVLGKRQAKSDTWELVRTQYKGHVRDAHNSISIMVDGQGYLHAGWDHHGNRLRYAVGKEPLSLDLGPIRAMTGLHENTVTYPEFYRMPSGDLLFFYRDGGSGKGNLLLNRYDFRKKEWTQVCENLLDGQGQRNAYWQACVDPHGVIHVSWVWRETPNVATNHDMCYARSVDGGLTWENSDGSKYDLPINATTAEYITRIPQQSELINSTSMTTDRNGNPFIATYWRGIKSGIPQYHVVHYNGKTWNVVETGFRNTDFSLSGSGTKRIPIARPQVIVSGKGSKASVTILFRDEERSGRVSMAECRNISRNIWKVTDISDFPVGSWEPSYDTELWRLRRKLDVFVQRTDQVDAEGVSKMEPQPIFILEVNN